MTDKEILGRLRRGEPLKSFLSPADVLSWRKDQNPYRLSRRVGVEIEFIGYDPEKIALELTQKELKVQHLNMYSNGNTGNNWTLKTDGSVNLSPREVDELSAKGWPTEIKRGLELSSPPLTAKEINQINRACEVLTQKCPRSGLDRAQINETCSLHTHVDISHNPLDEQASIYYTYVSVRDQLELIIADHRIYSNGGGFYAKNHTPTSFGATLVHGKYADIRTKTYVPGDVNPGSGTFEYRKGHPTKNAWSIKGWMAILDAIHLYGENNLIESPKNLNFYDVVHYPILWDVYNARKDFLFNRAKLNKKWVGDRSGSSRIVKLKL